MECRRNIEARGEIQAVLAALMSAQDAAGNRQTLCNVQRGQLFSSQSERFRQPSIGLVTYE